VSTAAAATPAPVRPAPARTRWPTVVGAVAAAGIAWLLQLPLLSTEPLFVLVSTAVVGSVVAVGGSLARAGERTSGAAFAAAGLVWMTLGLDRQLPWGPVVAWVTTGLPAVGLGIGVMHYRRHPTGRAERAFPPVGLVLTVGARLLTVPLINPVDLGFPAEAWWPAPWAGTLSRVDALEISRATLLVLAGYIVVLGWRAVKPLRRTGRWRLWPVLLSATVLAAAVAGIQVVTLVLGGLAGRHTVALLTGVVVLVAVSFIPVGGALRRGFGAGSARRLPRVRTPETAAQYVRELTGDPAAELLYAAPDGELLDGTGHRRSVAEEIRPGRFCAWVHGDAGRLALLTGDPGLGADPDALREWLRALAVVAESARPSVLLRTRLARATALRVAEEMTFAEERERFRRDLHDGLHQTIAAARMDLDGLHGLPPGAAEAVVTGLEAKMAIALAQVQSLGGEASPTALDTVNPALDSAIAGAAAGLRLRAGVQVSGGRLGVLTLPVFLLVREAMTNVAKHAGTTAVDVRVRCDGRTVDIEVRDHGRGGAVALPGGRIGDICLRVEELGGTVLMHSPAGCGTTLRATIPCV
jgi:signal transduction histidine kinase